ncbi:SAM-dependent methyltransferase [Tenacibaculum sp. SZ-18]|uniref:THUMP-like domain-containing protein n=1 Tax=Tenacibaculum sp. SZ-18 TaxID=754423 RepID=UPI000C2D2C35|nr:class I SAM-dependent methyltransferase [Tenacibaculum sp. SZ-18]AUC17039.1 SAM-dependent methyltransferase [Tenacibaculum sp. SZ-18]
MNSKILNTEVQDFIDYNLNQDISKIIFKGSPFSEITIQELANQITAKKKSERKLPTWFQCKNIYYPPKISIEQTSSEITAKYKSEIVKGESLIDLTGGFGIDSFYFSKRITHVTHCEINSDLSKIVACNYNVLGVNNIETKATDGIRFLVEQNGIKFDWVYIDPSRRDDSKNKVFLLKDCAPNVPEELDNLFLKTNNILIKVSPILDITSTIRELKYVKEVHIVAIQNEVKELLFVLEKNFSNDPKIIAINIKKSNIEEFEFNLLEKNSTGSYSMPLKYLYEPNSAILKSGGFEIVTHKFNVNKIQQHSHLYTSDKLTNFPGRSFLIEKVIPYNKKEIKKHLPSKKANITVRNFPKTVAQVRKETKLSDGGNIYIFFTTLNNGSKVMIISEKIN